MKIHKGDKVIVITGKDKGKTGTVSRAIPADMKVVVDGLNIAKKHMRPKKGGQKGSIVERAMPIHVSNVMLIGADGKRTRKRAK